MAVTPVVLGPHDLSWDLLTQVEELQRLVWDFPDRGACYPGRLYRIQAQIGGTPLVAVAGEECVGFLLGLAAYDGKGPYVWSQIMGVHPDWRGRGLGSQLKWRQRALALANGVNRVEWTFDPLEGLNSFFNLNRLGACGFAYERQVYGGAGGAGGPRFALPSDRVRVTWDLRSQGVEQAAGREYVDWSPLLSRAPRVVEAVADAAGFLTVERVELDRDDEYLLVRIPPAIQTLLAADDRGESLPVAERFPRAWAWRKALREALEHYLGRGWNLVGALRQDDALWQVLARATE